MKVKRSKKGKNKYDKFIENLKRKSKMKKVPFYIVKRTSHPYGEITFRVHDIYCNFCWSSVPSLDEAINNISNYILEGFITKNKICEAINNINCIFDKEEYLSFDSWKKKRVNSGKSIRYNYHDEYYELLKKGKIEFYNNSGCKMSDLELIDFDKIYKEVNAKCDKLLVQRLLKKRKEKRKKDKEELLDLLFEKPIKFST